LKRGIDKGVTTVTVKSKEALETTQLRSQVKTLQEEKQRGLEELGNIVYTLYVQGTLETEAGRVRVRVKCSALAALDQKIRDKQDEIRQVQLKAQEALGRTPPPSLGVCVCGVPVYEGTKFCGGCGKNVDEILSHAHETTPHASPGCPRCGSSILPESKFCGACGSTLGSQGEVGG
jgi:DNA-directed RNA polymerase subunit RPC12/RpoP